MKIPLLLPVVLLLAAHSTVQAEEPARLVAVTGQGSVSVKPDRARLTLAVDQVHPELRVAEAEVNRIVRAYLAEAKALGARDKQLSTAGMSINPEYVWDEKANRQQLVGYRVRREIQVVIENLDQLGDYVLRATRVGVNQVSSPVLESSQSAALQRQALVAAAEDARGQAELLAKTLGMSLGAVRSLRADSAAPPPMPMVMQMRAKEADSGGNAEIGFAAGEIRIQASASAEFDLIRP